MTPAPAPLAFQSTANQVSQSWACVIEGPPRTKKTSQRIVTNPRTGKPLIIPSVQQTEWARAARLQVQAAWGGAPALRCHVNVAAVFYRERATGDLDNYLAALLDVLQPERRRAKKGQVAPPPAPGAVLANDRQVVSHDGSRLDKDARRPRVEVTVHWAVPLSATPATAKRLCRNLLAIAGALAAATGPVAFLPGEPAVYVDDDSEQTKGTRHDDR